MEEEPPSSRWSVVSAGRGRTPAAWARPAIQAVLPAPSCREEDLTRHPGGVTVLFSRVRLFVTPWTAARQASLSITNSRSLFHIH